MGSANVTIITSYQLHKETMVENIFYTNVRTRYHFIKKLFYYKNTLWDLKNVFFSVLQVDKGIYFIFFCQMGKNEATTW